ncbi:hypothetical protein HDU67_004268 [Dinochytrium kinnereticum]|nr:hypothetical protein HDU67_004268 [Dinochytrium kinnereticum]
MRSYLGGGDERFDGGCTLDVRERWLNSASSQRLASSLFRFFLAIFIVFTVIPASNARTFNLLSLTPEMDPLPYISFFHHAESTFITYSPSLDRYQPDTTIQIWLILTNPIQNKVISTFSLSGSETLLPACEDGDHAVDPASDELAGFLCDGLPAGRASCSISACSVTIPRSLAAGLYRADISWRDCVSSVPNAVCAFEGPVRVVGSVIIVDELLASTSTLEGDTPTTIEPSTATLSVDAPSSLTFDLLTEPASTSTTDSVTASQSIPTPTTIVSNQATNPSNSFISFLKDPVILASIGSVVFIIIVVVCGLAACYFSSAKRKTNVSSISPSSLPVIGAKGSPGISRDDYGTIASNPLRSGSTDALVATDSPVRRGPGGGRVPRNIDLERSKLLYSQSAGTHTGGKRSQFEELPMNTRGKHSQFEEPPMNAGGNRLPMASSKQTNQDIFWTHSSRLSRNPSQGGVADERLGERAQLMVPGIVVTSGTLQRDEAETSQKRVPPIRPPRSFEIQNHFDPTHPSDSRNYYQPRSHPVNVYAREYFPYGSDTDRYRRADELFFDALSDARNREPSSPGSRMGRGGSPGRRVPVEVEELLSMLPQVPAEKTIIRR